MIRILCVGKIKEKYLKELITDYLNRIKKYHKIEIIELKDNPIYEKEIMAIKEKIKPTDYNIALDILGNEVTSVSFSQKIDQLLMNYGNITFIIGGSLGLDKQIKSLVNECISFSNLTFPHGLFRGILLEQIYRSFKIINNETYHK